MAGEYLVRVKDTWHICHPAVFMRREPGEEATYEMAWAHRNGAYCVAPDDADDVKPLPE